MGVPSVVKIKKGNVEYTSKVDVAKYTIRELTRRAMMDVAKYVLYNVRKNLHTVFPYTKKHKMANRYQYWVPKKENYLVLGIENRKAGAVSAWWADQLELDSFAIPSGGKPRPKSEKRRRRRSTRIIPANLPQRHLLETFVKKHIDKIVEIESQYLKTINNESAAVALARATEDMEVLRGDES